MKLRLFAIRELSTGRIVPNLFFADKQAAKAKRDELVKDHGPHCVTYGPDHRGFKG